MLNTVKIGMAQLLIEGREPERNFQRAENLVKEAADKGCRIVLLPETVDFAWTHPAALTESKNIPGPFSDFFCQLAQKYNIYICVGLTERVPGQTLNYNTALLINNIGEIILKH